MMNKNMNYNIKEILNRAEKIKHIVFLIATNKLKILKKNNKFNKKFIRVLKLLKTIKKNIKNNLNLNINNKIIIILLNKIRNNNINKHPWYLNHSQILTN